MGLERIEKNNGERVFSYKQSRYLRVRVSYNLPSKNFKVGKETREAGVGPWCVLIRNFS